MNKKTLDKEKIMRIEIEDGSKLGLVAMVGAAIGKDDWAEKKDFNSEEVKKSQDGRTIHTTRKAMLWMDENGEEVRDLSVAVIETAEVKAMGRVRIAGKTWITHYIKDGRRLGVSIVAERLEPVKAE